MFMHSYSHNNTLFKDLKLYKYDTLEVCTFPSVADDLDVNLSVLPLKGG